MALKKESCCKKKITTGLGRTDEGPHAALRVSCCELRGHSCAQRSFRFRCVSGNALKNVLKKSASVVVKRPHPHGHGLYVLLERSGHLECALDGFVVCGLGFHDFLAFLFVQPLCLILPCARLGDRFHGCVGGIAFRPRCALLGLRLLRSPLRDDHKLLQVILHPVKGIRDPLVWDRLRCGWFRDRRLVPSLTGVVPSALPQPPTAAAQGFILTWKPPLSSHPRKGTQLPPTLCQKASRPHNQRPQPFFRFVQKVFQMSLIHTHQAT